MACYAPCLHWSGQQEVAVVAVVTADEHQHCTWTFGRRFLQRHIRKKRIFTTVQKIYQSISRRWPFVAAADGSGCCAAAVAAAEQKTHRHSPNQAAAAAGPGFSADQCYCCWGCWQGGHCCCDSCSIGIPTKGRNIVGSSKLKHTPKIKIQRYNK